MSTDAIATHDLTKTYGDRPALEPLSITVPGGQRVAVVGHNGSGKTTLLKMLAGLLDPSSGDAEVFGHPVGSVEARRAVSWLSDNPTFYDDLSVNEHLEYTARLHGETEWAPTAEQLLRTLGIDHRADDLPTTFSRGLRQKAAIAIGLIRPLSVLLVDEPFVGLDEGGKQALLTLLDRAGRAGATLVVATHELTFVDRVDRLIALRDGALVFDGAPHGADVHSLVKNG